MGRVEQPGPSTGLRTLGHDFKRNLSQFLILTGPIHQRVYIDGMLARGVWLTMSVVCLALAADKRPLEFRDLIELNEPSQPRISPDGTQVVFLLTRASVDTNSSKRSLWIVSRGTSARKLLEEAPIGPAEWTADGQALLLRLARPGNVAFWRVSTGTAAATPVFEHPNPIFSAWWSLDKSAVLFTSAEVNPADDRRRIERDGVLYDETIHGIRSFTRGPWTRPAKPRLWLWRTGNKAAEPVIASLDAIGGISSIAWSPDGTMAAIEYTPAQPGAAMTTQIGILHLGGEGAPGRFEPLITAPVENRSAQWLPDSRSLVFSQTGSGSRYYVPASTIRTVAVSERRDVAVPGNGPWYFLGRLDVDRAGDILAEYDDWSTSTLYRVARAGGAARPIYPGKEHLSAFHLSGQKRFAACIRQSFTQPPEVAILDLSSGALAVLTNLNPAFEQISLLPATERRFRNRFGHESNGFLILPDGFKKGTPVPLVMIHYAFSNKFTAQAQWITSYPVQHLAAAGIAVLLHNYPRELGWTRGDFEGAALSQAYNPLTSMEAAVETLAREGIIDPKRTGIAGWSFGAWLAELAITQSDLFRVASAGEGGLNNAGQYWVTGSAGMQEYLDAFYGGPPFGDAYANYKQLAPALNADRVRAPLMREYGSDVGVQSLEFYMALRRLKKPVEQYIYPGAPHVFDLPSHRLASMQRNLDWFRFWLQGYQDPDPGKREQYRRWATLQATVATK